MCCESTRTSRGRRRATVGALIALAWLGIAALSASAAYGPVVALHAGSHGQRAWRAKADMRISFVLPSSWERARGSQEGTLSIGSYDRFVDLGMDGTCTLTVTTAATVTNRPPGLRHGLLLMRGASGIEGFDSVRVHLRGGHAPRLWYIGDPQASTVDAAAILPKPPALPRNRPRLVVAMELTRELERISSQPTPNGFPVLNPTSGQRRQCAKLERQSVAVMRAALTSTLVEAGNPYNKSLNG